jgi:hypothetical protein
MPPWCSNHLVVTGDPVVLADFAAQVAGQCPHGERIPLRLASVVPVPRWLVGHAAQIEEADLNHPDDFCPDPSWGPNQAAIEGDKCLKLADEFSWRIVRWGTQWELEGGTTVSGRPESGQISYDFQAICAPPVPWVGTASERWPNLTFELCYAEPVTDLAGRIKLTGGVYAIDEMWEGREAHDQLAALGWDICTYWETDPDAPEQDRLTGSIGPQRESLDEELPALDESLWTWDESAGTEP